MAQRSALPPALRHKEELLELVELKKCGAINEAEFEDAKQALFASSPTPPISVPIVVPPTQTMGSKGKGRGGNKRSSQPDALRPSQPKKPKIPAGTRTLFNFPGFHRDRELSDGIVVRLDSVLPAPSEQLSRKAQTFHCPHCHFHTQHPPALASHVKNHRVLGVDLVDPEQHRLDGLGMNFQREAFHSRFPGVPTDVILCVNQLVTAVENKARLEQQKPRQVGSRGSSTIRPHSTGFKARVLAALLHKRRYTPCIQDKAIATRFSIHKSLLPKWLQQAETILSLIHISEPTRPY
eukprot:TRINITY_DN403_c0_g1_i3.p1 TRINITY_DN403_c0_g1~~TRINITY_DN403_c0_g1_i3.p1  ORF type:complete len:294 (-),score=36.32 TRINITY_DN403_c0_g1_i3:155-1036(-)